MSQMNGKQILDASIAGAKLVANTVTASKVASDVIVAAGTNAFSGNQAMGGFKFTGAADPTSAQEFATKAYVDALAAGLDLRASVALATIAALPACTPAGTGVGHTLTADAVGILTVDGVATVLNDRILVKDQADAGDNGIYKVTTEGTAGVAFVLTRALDADSDAEVTRGMFTFVEKGSLIGTGWVLIAAGAVTVDTTDLPFTQFSTAAAILGGAGLLKTGSTIDVVIASGSGALTANTNDISVNYGTATELADVDAAAEAAGTSELVARADHKHGVSTGTPVAVGTANAAGSATSLAKSDHVHDSAVSTTSNKGMTASVTTSDYDQATATTVVADNALGGYIGVRVNGLAVTVSSGARTGDCYFSGDSGATARAFSAVVATDTMHWVGSVAGYQLAATDRIDIDMDTF